MLCWSDKGNERGMDEKMTFSFCFDISWQTKQFFREVLHLDALDREGVLLVGTCRGSMGF